MRRRRLLAAVGAFVVTTGVLLPTTGASANDGRDGRGHGGFHRVGYFTQWGIYDRGFLVKNLAGNGQAARLTTLNYAFGNVGPDGQCFQQAGAPGQSDPFADYQKEFTAAESVDGRADRPGQALAGNFNQLRKLKQRFPNLRVQLSLGGWTWSKWFSDAVLTEQSRRAFAKSCIELFIKGNLPVLGTDPHGGTGAGAGVFDGIDFDWEWPGSPGNDGNVVRPDVDKHNFTLAVAEFRRQLDELSRRTHKRYSLTAFLAADPAQQDNGYEVPKLLRLLDFATVQGYDMHGSWEDVTNHQSALFAPKGEPMQPDFTVDRAVTHLIQGGAPRSKLVVGLPLYSYGWTGVKPVNFGLFQQGALAPGPVDEGTDDYRNVTKLATNGTFKVYRDRAAGFSWIFDGTTFWTYDDATVMGWKTGYIRDRRLGGAMVWSLDGDDDNGTLIKAIARGLRH